MTWKTWPEKPAERVEFLARIIPENQNEFIQNVVHIAEKLGYRVYIVGGFVRDTILGLPASDLDIVVEGDASILAEEYKNHYGGIVIHHKRFMTTSLILPLKNNNIALNAHDIVSARSEVYERPGALPIVKRGTIHDDIRRRDFTINTLAISLNRINYGELLNESNGIEDLEKGIVRILHYKSFLDDPTRIFRAARYAVRFNFIIEKNTQKEIASGSNRLSEVSGQRIRNEINLIMNEENPSQALSMLENWGILKKIHPGISSKKSYIHQKKIGRISPGADGEIINWTLWLMHLEQEIIREINMRLHFTKYVMESLISASKIIRSIDTYLGISPSVLVNKLEAYPLSAINAIICILPDGKINDTFHEYIDTWRHIKPKISGNTLRKSGIPPGPVYRTILGKIKDALVDGKIKTANEERILLEKLISEINEDNCRKKFS